jgi:hypothetical protein
MGLQWVSSSLIYYVKIGSDDNNPLLAKTKTLRVRRQTETDLIPNRKLSDEISPRTGKSQSLDELLEPTSPKDRRR